MDFDSLLITLSFVGLGMAPFWAGWWDAALVRRISLSRRQRMLGTFALGTATTLVAFAGPWFVMMATRGTLGHNLRDPQSLLIVVTYFGLPSLGIGALNALRFTRRDETVPATAETGARRSPNRVITWLKRDWRVVLFYASAGTLAGLFDWLTGHIVPDWVSFPAAALLLGLPVLLLAGRAWLFKRECYGSLLG